MASLIKISLLLAIAPLFVAAFCTCELNIASAVAPSVQSLYHAALAETLVDSPQSLSSLEPAAGSSTTGQYQRYDNTGGSNYSSELEVPRGIFASLWRHLANPLPMGTSTVYAKSSTVSSHSQVNTHTKSLSHTAQLTSQSFKSYRSRNRKSCSTKSSTQPPIETEFKNNLSSHANEEVLTAHSASPPSIQTKTTYILKFPALRRLH